MGRGARVPDRRAAAEEPLLQGSRAAPAAAAKRCCGGCCCPTADVCEAEPAKKRPGCCACLRLRFYQYRIVTGMYVLEWWEALLLNMLMVGLLWLGWKVLMNIGTICSQYGVAGALMLSFYYTCAMYFNRWKPT